MLDYRTIVKIQNINTNVRTKNKWYYWVKEKITINNWIIPEIYYKFSNKREEMNYKLENLQIDINTSKTDSSYGIFYSNTYRTTFLGSLFKKQQTEKKIIIKHKFIEAIDQGSLIYRNCEGCFLKNCKYNSASCYIEIEKYEDFLIINNNYIKKKQNKIEGDIELFKQLAIYLYNYNNFYRPQKELRPNSYINNPQKDSLITKYIERTSTRNELYKIQEEFKKSKTFEFYTDGSLIEQGTINCALSCAFKQIGKNAPVRSFATELENWPSSIRSELSAIILAIITVPKNSNVTIYTDSLNSIKHIQQLEKNNFIITERSYFKQDKNNKLWKIYVDIIKKNNINVDLVKVPAHSDNIYNNEVDSLCKQIYGQNTIIKFNSKNFDNIKVIPKWKDIEIEMRLRKFITIITRTMEFEKFYNLNRNGKYRINDIHWESTFEIINTDITKTETDFPSSRKKAMKIKFLIEEISTINQMRKSLLSIYENWKCPICGIFDEHFDHIWVCSGNISIIQEIREDSVTEFSLYLMENNIDERNIEKIMLIWGSYIIDVHQTELTFINIIKGVVPLKLFEAINEVIAKQQTIKILIDIRHFLYNRIMQEVWIPRVNYLREIEKEFNITKNIKKQEKGKKNYLDPYHKKDEREIENNLESIKELIYFGRDILNYYSVHTH
jgi:ribonuclease HI